jgi:hypothetical protein
MEGDDQIKEYLWWICNCMQGGVFIPFINDSEIPDVVLAHTALIRDSQYKWRLRKC